MYTRTDEFDITFITYNHREEHALRGILLGWMDTGREWNVSIFKVPAGYAGLDD